jgi:hypothetical protein
MLTPSSFLRSLSLRGFRATLQFPSLPNPLWGRRVLAPEAQDHSYRGVLGHEVDDKLEGGSIM